jgi:NAD-dependent DNA ligase
LIAALRHRPAQPRLGRIKNIDGKRLSFTGFLSRPRKEAIAAAKKAGAIVETKPGPSSNVLVRGRPNAQQIAGADAGVKLLEVRRLADLGHAVTVIGEKQFWKLVESAVRLRKAKRARKGARRA